LHHRLEGIVAVVAIETLQCPGKGHGNHLPTQTSAIFAPSTHALATAIDNECIPKTIDVSLRITRHLEADCLAVGDLRSTVQCGKWFAEEIEFDRENGTFWVLGVSPVVADVAETRTREEFHVETSGIECLGVEPQVGGQVSDGRAGNVSAWRDCDGNRFERRSQRLGVNRTVNEDVGFGVVHRGVAGANVDLGDDDVKAPGCTADGDSGTLT